MLKKFAFFSCFLASNVLLAAQSVDLHDAPLSSLNQFPIEQQKAKASSAPAVTSLQQVNKTLEEDTTIVRYQQMYKGVPIIGAQVMVSNENGQNNPIDSEVNGHLVQEISVSTKPAFSAEQAIEKANKSYFSTNQAAATHNEVAQLQLRPGKSNELQLVYQVSFKSLTAQEKPVWPFFIIDAQTGEIIKQWNNIKNYSDTGPGGNEKTHEYWYGKDGLPALNVEKKGDACVMDNAQVKVVHLDSAWDWFDRLLTPYEYPCGTNTEENVSGAYSPINDAYFFGQVIVDMYKDWYGVNALQKANGAPMKLVMRVHFGQSYDNAFWDGETMSFGDGKDLYPLVSLDIAGHEVTHGFTEQHSGLEYHDQSGAMNESLSDMGGQAARAYLLEKMPTLYNKAYLAPGVISWGIGETVTRDSSDKGFRFMDYPSSDGSSADCLDKQLAQSHGAYCVISYKDVVNFANLFLDDPLERQSFIVHTASGVYNKAFYLLSKELGIKEAYRVMLTANSKYWTPNTQFKDGACGVLRAAQDLNVQINKVQTVFGQVGIDTKACAL